MTPFALHALLAAGVDPADRRLQRALVFVRGSIGDDGAIGYADPELLEYPVYATALGVLVLARVGAAEDRSRIGCMADWLVDQQCGESRGFTSEHPAYGAFGFGARGLLAGESGHVDITHTRLALQALARSGRLDESTRRRALLLLARLQHADGGFHFSPVVAAANKAARDDAGGDFRPYATATADGLLALRALGCGPDDVRVRAATRWLARHARADRIGGIDERPPEPWHDALRFYHAMVLAEAHPPLRDELRDMLAARQAANGGFASELVSAMKEDDPLLATALAVRALAAQ